MYKVVNSEDPQATGKRYHIDGFEIIGKTGTAQIASARGGYLKGESNYIYSFAGMYPKDNPEVIIYAAVKKPNIGATVVVSDSVNNIMKNIAKYRNMFKGGIANKSNVVALKLDSFTNKKTEDIKKLLEDSKVTPIIIGSGDKIISQFPGKGETVLSYDKVILVTNKDQNKMPSLKGYSRGEAIYLMKALGFKYEIDGYGYVTGQSIEQGNEVKENDIIKITLSEKYEEIPN